MQKTKALLTSLALIALVAVLALSMPVAAQNADGGERGERAQQRGERVRGGDGEGRRQWDPETMRARMMEAMKQRLGASDDEWAVIEPRLVKVSELRRQANGGGMRGMIGRGGFANRGNRGDRGGEDNGQAERPERRERPERPERDTSDLSPVQVKSRALGEVLRDESATPEQISNALSELRAAREAAAQELETAQASLREVLSLRQEAMLVTMGMLE